MCTLCNFRWITCPRWKLKPTPLFALAFQICSTVVRKTAHCRGAQEAEAVLVSPLPTPRRIEGQPQPACPDGPPQGQTDLE